MSEKRPPVPFQNTSYGTEKRANDPWPWVAGVRIILKNCITLTILPKVVIGAFVNFSWLCLRRLSDAALTR